MRYWYVCWVEDGIVRLRQQGDKIEAEYWRDMFARDNKPATVLYSESPIERVVKMNP
jgi:hypothetical protein